MQETIRALRNLQEIDHRIFRTREELRRLPAELETRKASLDDLALRQEAAAKTARDLRFKIREIEDHTSDQRRRMRKVEGEASGSRSDMALLAAYQHEIRTLKREISTAEEEGLGLLEQVESAERDAVQLEGELGEARKVFEEFAQNVVNETADAKQRLEALQKERAAMGSAKDVDPEAATLYARLLEAREGVALAELEGRICQMCFMEVTPNLYVRVVRGTQIVQCPSCDRILFQRD